MKLCGTCLLWLLGIPKLAKQAGAELGQAQLKLELRMLTGAKRIYSLLKVDWRWSKTAKNRAYLVLVVGKGKIEEQTYKKQNEKIYFIIEYILTK